MTPKQLEMIKICDKKSSEIGNPMRNRDANVRANCKIEGTVEHSVLEGRKLMSGQFDELFTDEYCQKIIDIIS